MSKRTSGSFEVKITPQPAVENVGDPAISRMALDKRFHGGLEATSRGEMLAFRSLIPGSAGYVAMERVSGSLDGRTGSFIFKHDGTMTRGAAHLTLSVVPDSGTDELLGLSGSMVILVADGKHSYEFEYEFASPS